MNPNELLRALLNHVNIHRLSLSLSTISHNLQSKMSTPVVYHSLQRVLDVLNNENEVTLSKAKAARELISIYKEYDAKSKGDDVEFGIKKHPVIIIEGLDAVGKTTITNRLAKLFNAELLMTPPQCIKYIRSMFDGDVSLRSAYYSLGNYIAAAQIVLARTKGPVVLDRYWHSTAAYALAEAVKCGTLSQLPPRGSDFYKWPSDLLKPDAVFYLTVSEKERQLRHRIRNTTNTSQEQELQSNDVFRATLTDAYKNMTNPGVREVNANGTVDEILDDIRRHSLHLFQ